MWVKKKKNENKKRGKKKPLTRIEEMWGGGEGEKTQYPPSEDGRGFGAPCGGIGADWSSHHVDQYPAWQNLVDWVKQSSRDFATEEDMLNMVSSDRLVNMEIFLKSLSKYQLQRSDLPTCQPGVEPGQQRVLPG